MSKVILVSGGSKGLGQVIVEKFLEDGDKVITFSRTKTPFIEAMQRKYNSHQCSFYYEVVDINDLEIVAQFIKRATSATGAINVLINNAAVAMAGVLPLCESEQISKVVEINLTSLVCLTKLVVKEMLKFGSGSIINISSIVASRGFTGLSVYSMTKSGMEGFTRSLARELGSKDIRVNSICPGYMETDMSSELSKKNLKKIQRRTPLGKLIIPDDVFYALKFFTSDSASMISGQSLVIDGGFTC